jgi:hypothetical protein
MKNLEYYIEELRKSKARLRDLNEFGAEALSWYDVKIPSMQDAKSVLKAARQLISNHISYYKDRIAEIERKLNQPKFI